MSFQEIKQLVVSHLNVLGGKRLRFLMTLVCLCMPVSFDGVGFFPTVVGDSMYFPTLNSGHVLPDRDGVFSCKGFVQWVFSDGGFLEDEPAVMAPLDFGHPTDGFGDPLSFVEYLVYPGEVLSLVGDAQCLPSATIELDNNIPTFDFFDSF